MLSKERGFYADGAAKKRLWVDGKNVLGVFKDIRGKPGTGDSHL
jgi:hypothetical protein